MKNKKIFLLILMLLVCILSVQALSATEYTANKEVTSIDNNQKNNIETNIQYDDVSTENKNDELILEENNGREEERKSETDETTAETNAELSFSELNTTINGNDNSTIYLSNNYKYNDKRDQSFKNGISIRRNLTVYGNGVTLDGNNMAGIFTLYNNRLNVTFYDINFINGNAAHGGAINDGGNAYNCNFTGNKATKDRGGAIYCGNAYNCTFTGNNANQFGGAINYGNAYNCTFIENTALNSGGAIYQGNAYNCTFTGNNATQYGGAIYRVNAYNCTFNENNASSGQAMGYGTAMFCRFNGDTTFQTTIIPAIINVLNYTSTKGSGEKLQFNLTANNTLYDGFNITIEIFKDGSLLKTVYGLSGDGWVVDLDVGEYTAVLSLTDYPDENSTNATITVTDDLTPTTTTITSGNSSKVDEKTTITASVYADKIGVSVGNATITITKEGAMVFTDTQGLTASGVSFDWTPNATGTYNINVRYNGGFDPSGAGEYAPSEANQTYTVTSDLIPTTTTITSGNSSEIGKPFNTTATITDPDGQAVTSGKANFTVTKAGEIVYTTVKDVKDGLSFEWTPESLGVCTLKITYLPEEGSEYDSSEDTQTFTVTEDKTPTTTTITSGNSSEIGKPFNTTATITSPDGQAVTSGKANFTVTKAGEIVYTTVKDVKDGLSFEWTPESLGVCTLKITYIPDEGSEYESSEDTQTFTVTEDKTPTTTTITSGSSSAVGKATVIKAKIIGNDGKKVSGVVLLKITNKKTGKTIVEKNINIKSGTFSYTWTPTQAGEYTINLKYKGNSQYESSSAEQKYQVKSEDTIIVKNVKMYYADGTKLIVKALNAQGKPKAKLTVNVKVAGKTFKLKTNSKGIAQLAIKLDPNTYKVITTVPGTSIKKVSTMTVNKWKKSLTSLKPKNLVMVYNTNKRFYVTLKHNKVRIAGEYIKVQVLKYTYYIKTNNKGVASLGIHYYPGTWKAKVSIDIAGVKLTKTAKIVVKKR